MKISKVVDKVKRNAKCIGKLVVIGGSTALLLASETAAMTTIINNICDGCDEDNPASGVQLFGSVAVASTAAIAELVTGYAGTYMVFNELENWE